jgi:hypothetical protein
MPSKDKPPLAVRGRKTQRLSGGGERDLRKGAPKRTDFTARYQKANRIEFTRDLLKTKRRPINEAARELLTNYHRRHAFWTATSDVGQHDPMSIELAGDIYLFAKKSTAHNVYRELEAAGGPRSWFVEKAREGIRSGKIARGRATSGCTLADRFFALLVGGKANLDEVDWRVRGGAKVVVIGEKHAGVNEIEAEALEYTFCRHLDEPFSSKRRRS